MSKQSRRSFIGTAVAAGALAASCSKSQQSSVSIPKMLDQAPDGPVLKAGLIGCGGRGKGAALQFISAGPNLQVTALADTFKDRLDDARNTIQKDKGQTVPEENCFVGFDGFQKVIDSGVDVILLATPPYFRPEHFAAAVAAGKNVFMEKPVAVDPVGARSVIETAGQAKTKNLTVVTGTQRRHQKEYVETYSRVADGAIGEIVAARCYWNQNQLWYNEKRPEWSEMEWMIRDWVNWSWLSGDHIVEQHVHNIDVISWFTGTHPVKAVGFGGKVHRVTGDQYDHFSIDYSMENGMHVHSMCRQINGCENNVSEFIVGTKGSTNCSDTIWNTDGSVAWQFEGKKGAPYFQEHIDMVTAIRTSEPINEGQNTAESTLVGIMGRLSAYTGKETTWKEMIDSELTLGPKELTMGDVDVPRTIAVPGEK
jgi:myo-inositol 2-dehydrogenase / D-chiro-inositol 1-dehydrogenase